MHFFVQTHQISYHELKVWTVKVCDSIMHLYKLHVNISTSVKIVSS